MPLVKLNVLPLARGGLAQSGANGVRQHSIVWGAALYRELGGGSVPAVRDVLVIVAW